ncbi:hypothetical protein KFL_000250515 [Klebsormidium nitens]|uniref:Uncharacterized protein n=1 Tax=Klebsormidium nitens TaxID=105231 RepID=A0A1Y1HKP7_KLENI|nr:hypothetical protein KFL_000250515 [Klebsormidium nitens]|eukprot:GAQ79175.1 hypothetical protein KFL_000250515 [Klebsormidium nitens]
MAPLTLRRLLTCAPPVLLGVICLLFRVVLLARFLRESPAESSSSSEHTVVTFHTHRFYPLRPIFGAAVNEPVGLLIVGELFLLLYVFAILAGVESCRMRAHKALKINAMHLLQSLAPAFTSCLAFCMVWLPYVLFSGGRERRAASAERNRLRPRMFDVWTQVTIFILAPSLLALVLIREQVFLGVLMAFSMILTAIFYGTSREYSPPSTATEMEEEAGLRYEVVVAFTLIWRLVTLVFIFNDPSLLSQPLALLMGRAGFGILETALLFFLKDLIGLTLCVTYFALLEDGPLVGLCMMVGTLSILGPAPTFAIYCTYRGRKIEDSMLDFTSCTVEIDSLTESVSTPGRLTTKPQHFLQVEGSERRRLWRS